MFGLRFRQPLALALSLLLATPALADTTLFEVTKGDQRLLVGGTIHLLHPDEYPLPEAFDRAYDEADALYLEADLEALNNPAFGQRLAQTMLYPQGTFLYDELSPEVWEQLKQYSEDNFFPLNQFAGFDPAFVSIVMTVMAAQQKGITSGVDEHFFQRAKTDGKPMGALESEEQIFEYMGAMTGLDGDAIIEATLHDLERFDELMDSTVEAWKTGNLERIDRDLGAPMREEAPELYQTLLVERNQLWMETIEPLLDNGQTELILVGSLHLVGEQNLLNLLEAQGYEVEHY